MAFKDPHVLLVSFAVDITPAGATDVMVLETDLHLNSRHPAYDPAAVRRLITTAQEYLGANAAAVTHVRLISNRSGEI